MKNILWVTTDGSDMSHEHHALLTEMFMQTGMWIRCFTFTDSTSMVAYEDQLKHVDVIAFDDKFPLHLVPKILREDKECILAARIDLSSSKGIRILHQWKKIEPFALTLTDIR